MRKRMAITVTTMLLMLVAVLAQKSKQKPAQEQAAQEQTPQEPAKPVLGQAQTQEEYNDYMKISQVTLPVDEPGKAELVNQFKSKYNRTPGDPELGVFVRVRTAEEFLSKYPESGLAPFVHQQSALFYQQLNDFSGLSEHGEKALEKLPENPLIMTILASAYAEKQDHDKCLEKAEKAIQLLNNMVKPAALTDEQWTQNKANLLSTNFASLGMVHLSRAQAGAGGDEQKKTDLQKAVDNFQQALANNKMDDISYYRMGISFTLLNKGDEAIQALAKAVAVNGVVFEQARDLLEKIYKKTHQDSLTGLDEIISKAKQELQPAQQQS